MYKVHSVFSFTAPLLLNHFMAAMADVMRGNPTGRNSGMYIANLQHTCTCV